MTAGDARGAAQENASWLIRGFEWSHPLLGHVNVWDSPDFCSPTPSARDMRHVWDWLESVQADDSLASFNHPGSRGTVLRFGGFQYRAGLHRRLVMPVRCS